MELGEIITDALTYPLQNIKALVIYIILGIILGLAVGGTVAGVVVGVIINGIFYTKINGKSIADYIEDGIEGLLEYFF